MSEGVREPEEQGEVDPALTSEAEEALPEGMPVLTLRNTVLFPTLITPMLATTERAKRLIEDALVGDRLLVAVTALDSEVEEPGPDDLHSVGTVIRILRMLETEAGHRLWVQGLRRVRVVEYVEVEPYLRGRIELLEDTAEPGLELEALRRNVGQQFLQLSEDSSEVPDAVRALVAGLEDAGTLSDVVASHLGLSVEDRQELLELTDVRQRLERLSFHLAHEQEVLGLEAEIREEVQTELSRSQREYVLREQARAIRRQLGEASSPSDQVEELREKLEAAGPPEQVRKVADRELERLK